MEKNGATGKPELWRGLSDQDLVSETKKCVAIEREATLAVIERIREIQLRLLHLEIGYSSLHEFCVVELGYSDAAAYRRIQAMELCEDIPKAKEAIAEGRLSLSNAAGLQSYLEKNPDGCRSTEEKERLLSEIEGKSRRECERIFYPERTGRKIEFLADDETAADLKRLSELLAVPESDSAALIKKIAKIALRSVDPLRKKTGPTKKSSAPPEKLGVEGVTTWPAKPLSPAAPTTKAKSVRYIPAAIKKAVWARDDSQCAYMNPETGRRCASHYGLQLDHITPVALGGRSTLDNLRLLCFAHNHFEAQRIFGREKMAEFNPALQ